MNKKKKSVGDLIMEYFKQHPKEDLQHGPVVDWVEKQYMKLYNKKPRDPWRQIRLFHEEGLLIQIRKGVYRYDPDAISKRILHDFTPEVKKAIFEKDGYKCLICGRGLDDGIEICADHIIPKEKGGLSTIDNGQTLCSEHNILKKNYSATTAAKKYFIKLYKKAVKNKDIKMINFCKQIFDVYD